MTTPTGGMPPSIDDELLSAYLDGQVTPAERGAVDAALAADPATRARAADLRATVALLRALPQPAPRRTFILTPEQAVAIRPVRVPWLARLFPAVAALSAVAAVLCLALIAGDRATGGFSTKESVTTARPAIESVSEATATPIPRAAAAPTTAAAPAAIAPAPAASASAASARSAGAPAIGAAEIAPTVGSSAGGTGALPATPTIVANAPASPPVLRAAPSGGATVTTETHRVPLALVRAGEIVLALLAIAGIALAALGRRRRRA